MSIASAPTSVGDNAYVSAPPNSSASRSNASRPRTSGNTPDCAMRPSRPSSADTKTIGNATSIVAKRPRVLALAPFAIGKQAPQVTRDDHRWRGRERVREPRLFCRRHRVEHAHCLSVAEGSFATRRGLDGSDGERMQACGRGVDRARSGPDTRIGEIGNGHRLMNARRRTGFPAARPRDAAAKGGTDSRTPERARQCTRVDTLESGTSPDCPHRQCASRSSISPR